MTPNTEVVCIDDTKTNAPIKNGDTYTVIAARQGICGCSDSVYLVDIGIRNDREFTVCIGCGAREYTGGVFWLKSIRFVPIDSISISEAYEVLEKEPFEL